MQRTTDQGLILACDFCGTDWDMTKAMIEGHKGSICCLDCLARAIDEAAPAGQPFACTLCLVQRDPPMQRWIHPEPAEGANAGAALCWDCCQQADRTFSRDADTEWQRRIAPTNKWR